jgi:hypothetical protein
MYEINYDSDYGYAVLWIRIRDPAPFGTLDLESGMGKKSISESLETIFGLKIIKFFDAVSDPGSGIFLTLDPRSGMEKTRIWDPG